MAPSFADILRSDQFTFLIGEERTPVVVHAAAVAATSYQIDRLMNGSMKEAGNKSAELKDITVDDFVRFCEYAYRGDYATPAYSIHNTGTDSEVPPKESLPSAEEIERLSIAQEEELSDDWAPNKKKHKGRKPQSSSKDSIRRDFSNRKYLSRNDYGADIAERFYIQTNTTDEQDFTPVFLAHARLYVFARMRLIDNLKALVLDKLHRTLVGFRLFDNRVGDIIELARYAYSNDGIPGRADDGENDELRDLVVNYIAVKHDVIGKAPVFINFIEEGGEFVGDFWGIIMSKTLSAV